MAFHCQIFEEQDALTILWHDNNDRPKDTAILLEYAFKMGQLLDQEPGTKIKTAEDFFRYINQKIIQ